LYRAAVVSTSPARTARAEHDHRGRLGAGSWQRDSRRPTRQRGEDEESQSALTKYLNQRIWDVNGIKVQVDEFQSTEEAGRPENPEDSRLWVRTVVGLKAEVAKTTIKSGVLELSDATKVNWYVHDPARVP
jgi:hypothetical protein